MRILVLEDSPARIVAFRRRLRGRAVTYVSNYNDAVEALGRGPYAVVYLDHDIADSAHNGQDVAFSMTRMPERLRPRKVVVHSTNPSGALGIARTLRKAGFDVEEQPFEPTSK